MIHRASIILLLFVTAFSPCLGQEVEFEIPEEISIVPGRLSVVFNEDVTEERARGLIASMQYEILEVKFLPLQIIGETESEISDRKLNRMNKEKGVETVVRYSDRVVFQEGDPEGSPGYRIAATFHDGITESKARKILKKHLRLISAKTIALPKEIVIDVGDNDEEAFDRLQNNKDVRWVTYVGSSEDI